MVAQASQHGRHVSTGTARQACACPLPGPLKQPVNAPLQLAQFSPTLPLALLVVQRESRIPGRPNTKLGSDSTMEAPIGG